MCIRSRGVWISVRSGPMDTQSSPGSLACQDAALQTGVDGFHLRLLTVLLPEQLHPFSQQGESAGIPRPDSHR